MRKIYLALKLAIAGATAGISVGAMAAPTIAVANFSAQGSTVSESYVFDGSAASTGFVQRSYAGTDATGNPGQTAVTAEAFAAASYNSLKTSARLSVDNPMQSAGVPSWFTATSQAQIQDNLLIGNSGVASIQFKLHIDGTLAAAPQATEAGNVAQLASIALRQNNATIYQRSDENGATFDDYVMSNLISVTGGMARLDIYLQSYVLINTLNGGYFSVESLFDHTTDLLEVYGFDSSGHRVALNGVRNSAGLAYAEAVLDENPGEVPEPGTLLLTLLGVALAGTISRKTAPVNRRAKWRAMAVAAAMAIPAMASAAPTYFSYSVVHASQALDTPAIFAENPTTASNGALASASNTLTYSGKDGAGNDATMSLNYTNKAQGNSSGLKASSYATLSNPFYNASNPGFVVSDGNGDFTTNPGGVPSWLTVSANVEMSDTFTIAGAAGLSYVTVSLDLDGQVQGNFGTQGGAYSQLYQTGQSFGLVWNSGVPSGQEPVSYDFSANTGQYALNNGKVNFGLRFLTAVSFMLFQNSGTFDAQYAGYADLFNTVTIDSFAGFDANGKPVDLFSVTGSDGTSYATVRVDDTNPPSNDVPEPTTLALMGIGILGLTTARKLASAFKPPRN